MGYVLPLGSHYDEPIYFSVANRNSSRPHLTLPDSSYVPFHDGLF